MFEYLDSASRRSEKEGVEGGALHSGNQYLSLPGVKHILEIGYANS